MIDDTRKSWEQSGEEKKRGKERKKKAKKMLTAQNTAFLLQGFEQQSEGIATRLLQKRGEQKGHILFLDTNSYLQVRLQIPYTP